MEKFIMPPLTMEKFLVRTDMLVSTDNIALNQWGSFLGVQSEDASLNNGPPPIKTRIFVMKTTKVGKSNLKMVYFPEGKEKIAGDTYTKSWKLFININP